MTDLTYPQIGDRVKVAQKKDYQSGVLTDGVVAQILTKQRGHPRGTKVRLENGIIGRIQEFVDEKVDKEEKVEKIYLDDPEALI